MVIDGSHIPIRAPADCPNNYYNRKGLHSTLMQGVVDHFYCLIVQRHVGCCGSAHDGGVPANSHSIINPGIAMQLVVMPIS